MNFEIMIQKCNNMFMISRERMLNEFEHMMYEQLSRFLAEYYRAIRLQWSEENDKKESDVDSGDVSPETDPESPS